MMHNKLDPHVTGVTIYNQLLITLGGKYCGHHDTSREGQPDGIHTYVQYISQERVSFLQKTDQSDLFQGHSCLTFYADI